MDNSFDESVLSDLTPYCNDLNEDGKEYFDAYFKSIDKGVNNKNVKNIALTGSYGSGKSTIIQKYISKKNDITKYQGKSSILKLLNNIKNVILYCILVQIKFINKLIINKQPSYFLNISLANFIEESPDKPSDPSKIEQSILQQMIYTQKPSKTSYSRFTRIKKVNKVITFLFSLGVCVISFFILLSFHIKIEKYRLVTIALLGIVLYFVLINIFKRCSLNKISMRSPYSSIELSKNSNENIFNKYLELRFYVSTL